jgi:Spy/CpxP family protein refolding chaperone
MKKYFALFAAVLVGMLMVSSGIAQDTTAGSASSTTGKAAKKGKAAGGRASHKADAELAELTKTLNLTEDQQAKIKPILTDQSAKIRAEKKGASITAEEAKEKHKEIRNTANREIRDLLTPDQQKLFDASMTTSGDSGTKQPAAGPGA